MSARLAMGLALGGAAVWILWRHVGLGFSEGAFTGPVWLEVVDGVPVERRAAAAFRAMQAAAGKAGVQLRLTSGFRDWSRQAALYAEYVAGVRTDVVAAPGRSNHQRGAPEPARGRGPAVDIEVQRSTTSPAGKWLAGNAAKYGFHRTVESEPWHWEYTGSAA